MIQQMQLEASVAPGKVAGADAGDGTFVTRIDATAGGFGANPPHAYVYARFSDAGMQKVEISDEASLESADWDIAFRRFVIRLNSGDGGPSCVEAARLPSCTGFTDAALPAEDAFAPEDFYTDACELVPDSTGLSTSPGTRLSDFYSYGGCLQMTGNVYVLRLASGRHVKLRVDAYYGDQQEACETSGAPSGVSGDVMVTWAFLE
jgi:hypothetical protein